MISESLETIEFLIDHPCRQTVHFAFKNHLCTHKHGPVTNHQHSEVLPWVGRLIEEHLEVVPILFRDHLLDFIVVTRQLYR